MSEIVPFDDGGYRDENAPPRKVVRVDVRGKSRKMWNRLRRKLVASIEKVLESPLDFDRGTTVREEAKIFTSALLDYAKAKLAAPVVEIEKAAAEIAKMHAGRQKELAEADKTRAETEEIRQRTRLRELRLQLGATKAMLVGETDEESLLLGRRLEAFLEVVRELAGSSA